MDHAPSFALPIAPAPSRLQDTFRAWVRELTGSARAGRAILRLGVLGLLAVAAARADTASRFTHWQTQDGLPSNKVMTVVQTRDRYVWIGTHEGLVRFDGVRFTSFRGEGPASPQETSVTRLYEAPDGTLWIGHSNGAVTRHRHGEFITSRPRPGWRGSRIQDLVADAAGDIWILDDTGELARLRDGRLLRPPVGPALGLFMMTASGTGRIWVASAGLLSELRDGRLEAVPLPAVMNNYVHGIAGAADGGLWATANGRLWKWSGTWQDHGAIATEGAPFQLLIELRDGRLAGGTSDHGAVLLDPRHGRPAAQWWRASGFASDWVTAVMEDHEGGLWLGTGGSGLLRTRQHAVTTLVPPDAWQGRSPLSVSLARDGGLWIGTDGAGLYRFRDGRWTRHAREAGIRNPYIWSVSEDAAGTTWLGTWGGGLYRSTADGFARPASLESFYVPMAATLPARDGGLWVGSQLGLLHGEDGRLDWIEPGPERRLRDVRALLEPRPGQLWVGTYADGLGLLEDGKIRQFRQRDGLASDSVYSLLLDDGGALWVGTRGGGLSRFKDGRFATIGLSEGLLNDTICAIVADRHGDFWLSSPDGIMRVSRAQLDACAAGTLARVDCRSYGVGDGMLSPACPGGMQPAGALLPDGCVVFPTDRGLAVIDPAKVHTNPHPPAVVLESLRAGDQLIAEGSLAGRELEIPAGARRIEIRYTGLSFEAPEKVRFVRRLGGLEPDLVPVGDQRVALYSYLRPGRYEFEVRAANNDNVWSPDAARLALVVRPHVWETVWFRAGGLLALLLVTASIGWTQARRRMQRRLDLLEQDRAIERERARIAHDMHDDLGAQLTRITMLSETARSERHDPVRMEQGLGLIYDTARHVTRAMDEIVWAVNPKHDTLASLVCYLEKFAQDLLGAAHLRCRLDMPAELPDWRPSSEMRHQLFLAYKEALNNAVRHAAADLVAVALHVDETHCRVTVQDNGRGFAAAAPPASVARDRVASGHGLASMRARLERIGGRCEIVTPPEGGTRVVLHVPRHPPAPGRGPAAS